MLIGCVLLECYATSVLKMYLPNLMALNPMALNVLNCSLLSRKSVSSIAETFPLDNKVTRTDTIEASCLIVGRK